jgi:capsule polysaccharide modification protein KpsS
MKYLAYIRDHRWRWVLNIFIVVVITYVSIAIMHLILRYGVKQPILYIDSYTNQICIHYSNGCVICRSSTGYNTFNHDECKKLVE